MRQLIRKIIPHSVRARILGLRNYAQYVNLKFIANSDLHFDFNKEKFKYYIALHNNTFTNERIIEIPIILQQIKRFEGKRILEIGNVISYYEDVKYDILDKYEKKDGVINCDIIDYHPKEKYDLIISISTFEHIGFDEVDRYGENKDIQVDQTSLIKAINNTKALLNNNGLFIFTVPLGFNSFLDSQLSNNNLKLTEARYLKRISADNKWVEVKYDDIVGTKYGSPYPCANGLLVGIYRNNG